MPDQSNPYVGTPRLAESDENEASLKSANAEPVRLSQRIPSLFPMSLPTSLVTDVTTGEFPTVVVASILPVAVDFWAPWCGPCRQLSPLLSELAKEYEGRLHVVKVNVDEEPALASSFGIRGIPALVFYKAGTPCEMITGMRSAAELRQWINHHLDA